MTMAPNLRSSSHARSNTSRPSTPLEAPMTASVASSFTESTRPRKQRRTGRSSRVATDPLDLQTEGQSQLEEEESRLAGGIIELQPPKKDMEWTEPPIRAPAPSYTDTPWSGVSSERNPVLASMRPLGTMPTNADLRKAGLVPSKPSTPNIIAKKELLFAPYDGANDDKPLTPLTPAEELPDPTPLRPKAEEDLAAFTVLPVPNSTDVDVEKLRTAVENALRLASETDNRPVIRGLIRLWEKCGKDPFALSILEGICQENPGPREKSAFQTVMRSAWKEVRSEQGAEQETTIVPTIVRTHSDSSASSLSSAKSLDVETLPLGVTSGASNSRSRKGNQAKGLALGAKENDASTLPVINSDLQPMQGLEEPESSTEQMLPKRTRLRKSLPRIVASESRLRSSLASNPPSDLSSPAPITTMGSFTSSSGSIRNRRERSESVASSEAEDNRRLTPSLSDNSRPENNDFCHNCNGSGQLLCCDGCVNSFHFSCLNPPLDPANPPEGDWYCPRCSVSRPMDRLLGLVDQVARKEFALPARIRDYFTGVRTSEDGKYEDIAPFPRINPRGGRGNRNGRYDDPYLLRLMDSKGNLIFCTGCGRTTNGRFPIIQCDYCPCSWHLDCLDPPLAHPPHQRQGSDRQRENWMCPNHVYHDLFYVVKDEQGYDAEKRIRRPKGPRLVDVEILPEESESEELEEQEEEGVLYRVSERGVKLSFIERVKRENLEVEMKKDAAEKYFAYAKTQLDELMHKARAFYASQKPMIEQEDTTTAILNSRSVAEREAAANLIEFAQTHQLSSRVENGRISLLIDQLKASAPKNLPSAETEIASLRTLQELIEQRIKVLNVTNSQSPGAQPLASNEQIEQI